MWIGLSECEWVFEEQNSNKQNATVSQSADVDIKQDSEDSHTPSAVFRGRLSLTCQPTEAGIVRSGYCAVRGAMPAGLLLHGYEGLAMRVMTDGRECVILFYNLKAH